MSPLFSLILLIWYFILNLWFSLTNAYIKAYELHRCKSSDLHAVRFVGHKQSAHLGLWVVFEVVKNSKLSQGNKHIKLEQIAMKLFGRLSLLSFKIKSLTKLRSYDPNDNDSNEKKYCRIAGLNHIVYLWLNESNTVTRLSYYKN